MQTSRDSSLLRSLATAFGDGVAFGVGVKLTQKPGRGPELRGAPETNGTARRLAELEKRIEQWEQRERTPALAAGSSLSLDQQATDALINALEARLKEYSGMVEKRLSELELRVSMELKSLRQQDESFLGDLTTLRDTLAGMHREFAQALTAMVEEQVANQVEANVEILQKSVESAQTSVASAFEEKLTTIRAETTKNLEALQKFSTAAFDEKLAALREEMTARTSEITDLQQRVHDSDRNVLEVILGMGEMCRQIGDRLGRQPAAESRVEAPQPDPKVNDVPGFAQQGGRGVLHLPLMFSVLLTGAGLFLLHLL